MAKEGFKATIYTPGMTRRVWYIGIGYSNFAQYGELPAAIYIKKGHRKKEGLLIKPLDTIYVVEGWKCPELLPMRPNELSAESIRLDEECLRVFMDDVVRPKFSVVYAKEGKGSDV